MACFFRASCPVRPGRTLFVIIALLVACAAAAWSTALGAADSPRLVVPASKVTLHVAVELPDSLRPAPGPCKLVEVDAPNVSIPAQLVAAVRDDGTAAESARRLLATIPPRKGVRQQRRFQLQAAKSPAGDVFRFEDLQGRSLKLLEENQPVLVYNHGVITNENVPERDVRRSRACYIHPVWGLSGEVLTDDFPRDHYHHHGIFWTWPHVGVEGKQYDLWSGGQIKDRFVRWISRRVGPVAAVVAVENGWFVGEKKVMIERVWIRTYRVAGHGRSIDLEFTWIPVGGPISLRGAGGKSYGGLTMRLAVKEPGKSIITTPGGSSKEDLKQTPLPWADLTAKFGGGDRLSGAAVFVHPAHPDYPPTWLTRHYGPLCVGWPGVKAKSFPPERPIRTNYRIFLHKTQLDVDQLEAAYQGYTASTKVKWQ